MGKWRWLIGCLVLTAQTVCAAELSLFDNQYTAQLYGLTIDVNSRLRAEENGNYEFSFEMTALIGHIIETSHLQWNPEKQQVVPLIYSYKRTGLGKNRDDSMMFDWLRHSVVNLKDNTRWSFDPSQNIQDNLSYQLQLRQDLIAGKKNLLYPLIDKKKFKDYSFEIMGDEILETPLGKVNTVKIRRAQTNEKREIYAWFAKDFQYLLVRLQQEENGSAYTIYISKASINGKAIEHF